MESVSATPRSAGGHTPSPGRPRDHRIDRGVLRATRELLEEVGYTKLTVSAVAARAGTTPPAVYRRWASKVELVYEAAFPTGDEIHIRWGESLEVVIRGLVEGALALMSQPATRAAISGLIAELAARPGLSESLLGRLQDGMYEQLHQVLEAAEADGQVAIGIDARYLVDMIGGAVLMSLTNERELGDAWVEQTCRVVMHGIRP